RAVLAKTQYDKELEKEMAESDQDRFSNMSARAWEEMDKKLENVKRFGDPAGDALRRMGEKGVVPQLSSNTRNGHRDLAKNIFEWILSFRLKIFLPRSRLNCNLTKDEVVISSSLLISLLSGDVESISVGLQSLRGLEGVFLDFGNSPVWGSSTL